MKSQHQIADQDLEFVSDFEACRVSPDNFHHREHIRLAYIYLVDQPPATAHQKVRSAIKAFIRHNGADESKYHETITQAWIMAVAHFMHESPPASSSDMFIELNPRLLDSKIMLSHYSKETLFSDSARAEFVEPDIESIPKHE